MFNITLLPSTLAESDFPPTLTETVPFASLGRLVILMFNTSPTFILLTVTSIEGPILPTVNFTLIFLEENLLSPL